MIKKLLILTVAAMAVVFGVYTAGQLVISGSPGLALIPVFIMLTAIFFFIRRSTDE